jgi:hypothetical protein
MARNESRAESIERLTQTAMRSVKAALKKRNISIPDIEGESEDDMPLRNLQHWQSVAKGLEDADSVENSAQAGNRAVSSYPRADAMDSVSDAGKGKKGV